MTRQQLKYRLDSYSKVLDIDEAIDKIERTFEEAGLSIENITSILIYYREQELEFSFVTKPMSDIHVYFDLNN